MLLRSLGIRHVVTLFGNFLVLLALLSIVVGNFAVLLRRSGTSPCCYGFREFRCVATVVGNSAVLAVGNFVVLLRLSGICRVNGFRKFEISSSYYSCREFRHVDGREFRRVATGVGNFAVLLRLPISSPLCHVCQRCHGVNGFYEIRGIATVEIIREIQEDLYIYFINKPV